MSGTKAENYGSCDSDGVRVKKKRQQKKSTVSVVNLWWSSCAIVLKTRHLHLLRYPFHSRPKKQTNWGDFPQTQQHYDCTWEPASTKQRGGARKQGSGYGKSTCSPWWPARPCARLPNGTQSLPVCESRRIRLHVSGGGGGESCGWVRSAASFTSSAVAERADTEALSSRQPTASSRHVSTVAGVASAVKSHLTFLMLIGGHYYWEL